MKKGFTLVELLGVIIILSVISLITIPLVDSSIKDSKEKVYNTQIKNIALAAKNWALDYMDEIGTNDVAISLGQLKIESYVDQDIKNPNTDTLFSDNLMIQINYVNSDYVVTVMDDKTPPTLSNSYSSHSPYVVLIGDAYRTIEVSTSYVDPGCLYFNANSDDVEEIATTYSVDDQSEAGFTTTIVGTHTGVCSGSFDGSQISIARTITVE